MKGALAALVLALPLRASAAPAASLPARSRRAQRVPLRLYWNPLDPQSWRLFFLADLAARRAGPRVALEVLPLLQRGQDGKWQSPRGPAEIEEAERIAVLEAGYPGRIRTYLEARGVESSAAGWITAARYAGLSPRELEARRAAEGERDLSAQASLAQAAGASSPAIELAGRRFDAEGGAGLLALLAALNSRLPAAARVPVGPDAPELTRDLVPKIWMLTDRSFSVGQDDPQLSQGLHRLFPDSLPERLDWSVPEAAKFKGVVDFLPAYVIQDNLGARRAFAQALAAGFVAQRGGYLVVSSKGRNGAFLSRPEEPGRLDLFIMSHCPFGIQAVNSLYAARKKGQLPGGLEVRLHYIADAVGTPPGAQFKSLHGPSEVEEDLRQEAIQERWPGKFWDYLAGRDKNPQAGDWRAAARQAGLDPSAVQKAQGDRGRALLAADARLTLELGIASSPSFLYRGRFVAVGLNGLSNFPGFEKVQMRDSPGGSCSN